MLQEIDPVLPLTDIDSTCDAKMVRWEIFELPTTWFVARQDISSEPCPIKTRAYTTNSMD